MLPSEASEPGGAWPRPAWLARSSSAAESGEIGRLRLILDLPAGEFPVRAELRGDCPALPRPKQRSSEPPRLPCACARARDAWSQAPPDNRGSDTLHRPEPCATAGPAVRWMTPCATIPPRLDIVLRPAVRSRDSNRSSADGRRARLPSRTLPAPVRFGPSPSTRSPARYVPPQNWSR